MVLIQITVLVIVDAIELWVLGLELLEHVTLDQKKPSGAVQNLGKPILNLSLLVPKIHNERRSNTCQVPTLFARLDICLGLIPHDALLWVRGARYIVTRLDETNHRVRVKVNIRINKQKVSRLGLLHETRHRQITGAMDQRLILSRIKHHLDAVLGARTLETKHGLGIGLETDATITRGRYEKDNLTHYNSYDKRP
jgi:hypothetical protein